VNTHRLLLLALFCWAGSSMVYAQNGALNEVHLIQSFFKDAAISDYSYGEGVFGFSDYEGASILNLGVRGGYPINPQFELDAAIAFLSTDPDNGDGESGISDLRVTGKYHLESGSETQFSVGGSITLPIGKDELGQGETNFGAFGAVRHPVAPRTVLTGLLAMEFLEGAPVGPGGWPGVLIFTGDRETVLTIGGGVIHQLNRQVHLIGEFTFLTEGDFGLLNGGIDYEMQSGNRLRGTLGLGLDDGAPDVTLLGTFLMAFNR